VPASPLATRGLLYQDPSRRPGVAFRFRAFSQALFRLMIVWLGGSSSTGIEKPCSYRAAGASSRFVLPVAAEFRRWCFPAIFPGFEGAARPYTGTAASFSGCISCSRLLAYKPLHDGRRFPRRPADCSPLGSGQAATAGGNLWRPGPIRGTAAHFLTAGVACCFSIIGARVPFSSRSTLLSAGGPVLPRKAFRAAPLPFNPQRKPSSGVLLVDESFGRRGFRRRRPNFYGWRGRRAADVGPLHRIPRCWLLGLRSGAGFVLESGPRARKPPPGPA